MKKFALLLLSLLILTACAGQKPASPEGTWKLVSYGDPASPTAAALDVETSIEFTADQVNGNVGCNGFGGDYTVDGNKLTFGQIVSTLMFCEGPTGDQEQTTLNVLQDTTTFALDGDTLTITSSDRSAVIVLARK